MRKMEGAEVILKELLDIHAQMLAGTATPGKLIDGLHPAYKESAKKPGGVFGAAPPRSASIASETGGDGIVVIGTFRIVRAGDGGGCD
ncbi:MAG: hypothetical protein WDO18_05470 [Acidobacteriota bacterium]